MITKKEPVKCLVMVLLLDGSIGSCCMGEKITAECWMMTFRGAGLLLLRNEKQQGWLCLYWWWARRFTLGFCFSREQFDGFAKSVMSGFDRSGYGLGFGSWGRGLVRRWKG